MRLQYDWRSDCFVGEHSIVDAPLVLALLRRLLSTGQSRGDVLGQFLDECTWEHTVLVAAQRVIAGAAVAEAERLLSGTGG